MLLPTGKAAEILGVHPNTLRTWANEGKIQVEWTPAGQRRYNIDNVLSVWSGSAPKSGVGICYCRVSSAKQRDDLQRQVAKMRELFPQYEIVQDIGSGLNFRRKGLTSLLERVLSGDVREVVVAHKDRLCRFGYELIEWLVTRNGGSILVLDNKNVSPQTELVTDLLSILHVFSCRMHGLRKYGSQIKKDPSISDGGTGENVEEDNGDISLHL